jgi:hypothetical protein
VKENLPPEIVTDISALTEQQLYVFVSSQPKIHFPSNSMPMRFRNWRRKYADPKPV